MSGAVSDAFDAVDSVAHAVESGVSAVVHSVESIAETIAHTIEHAISHLFHVLGDNIGYVALAAVAASVAITIFAPELWPVIGESLESMLESGMIDVAKGLYQLDQYWSGLTTWWANTVGPYVSDALHTIGTLNEVALIDRAFHNGHYLNGLTRLFQDVLPQISKEFDNRIQGVITKLGTAFNTLQGDISDVSIVVDQVNTGLGQVQTDLGNIGEAFGVKEVSELGDAIGRFRGSVLDRIHREAQYAEESLHSLFFAALNPFTTWDMMYQAIHQNREEATRRMAGLSAIGIEGLGVIPTITTGPLTFIGDPAKQVRAWQQTARQAIQRDLGR